MTADGGVSAVTKIDTVIEIFGSEAACFDSIRDDPRCHDLWRMNLRD